MRSWTTAGNAGLAVPVPQAPCQQYHLLDGSLLGKGWEDMASDHDVRDLFSYLPVDREGPLYKEMIWRGDILPPPSPFL